MQGGAMNRDDIIRMAREAGVAAEWQEKRNTYIELHDAVVKDNDRLYVAVAKMREVLEVQGRDGNWNFDRYMQGMFNGMEMMMSLAEGRDPVFRDPPEKWLHASPQRERVQFPTMLRKMWSGTEVQAWLDENVNQENNNE